MSGTRRHCLQVVAGLSALSALHGCASVSSWELTIWPFSGPPRLKQISLRAARDVNGGGYPVAVDVVFVRSESVLEVLGNLRAHEWFVARQDKLRQNPGQLLVRSWEPVPGQEFLNVDVADDSKGSVGVMVFADYLGEGSFRARIQAQRDASIVLGKDDFEVSE